MLKLQSPAPPLLVVWLTASKCATAQLWGAVTVSSARAAPRHRAGLGRFRPWAGLEAGGHIGVSACPEQRAAGSAGLWPWVGFGSLLFIPSLFPNSLFVYIFQEFF
jgi:hypothetical protein